MPFKITDNRPESEKIKGQRKREANQARQDYDAVLADLTANWSSLNPTAKSEALRRGLVMVLKLIRSMI